MGSMTVWIVGRCLIRHEVFRFYDAAFDVRVFRIQAAVQYCDADAAASPTTAECQVSSYRGCRKLELSLTVRSGEM